jgi:two-component system cell cycle sensor histidine kinase/response regulator CckA
MAKAQVLVVEDEGRVVEEIKTRLINLGYPLPEVVSSGEEAVKKVSEIHPDLVLMDVVRGGKTDGVEAAKQIRDRFHIPVIFLMPDAAERTPKEVTIPDSLGYVLNPFGERELQLAIEIALYRHQIEDQLKNNQQWLSSTLACIEDAVIVSNAQGGIQFMNSVAAALTGWEPEDALGRDLTEVFRVVERETGRQTENSVQKAMRENIPIHRTNYSFLLTKDGKEIPLDERATPIRD